MRLYGLGEGVSFFLQVTSRASVILAAGKGARMRSRVPKVLHRVCGKEMISLVVRSAEDAGLGPAYVVVPSDSSPFFDVLGDRVRYVKQTEQMGSGHALLQARSALDAVDNVAVLNGDVPLIRPKTMAELMCVHLESNAAVSILTATVSDPSGFGRVLRDEAGEVVGVIEEVDADEPTKAINEVNAGVYLFDTAWLWGSLDGLLPSPNGEVYITDLISAAAEQKTRIASFETENPEEIIGVNNRVQLAEAAAALQRRIRERWMVAGVTMHDPAAVYIDCDAEIGPDTVIHPNTHVGGATIIGQGCEIGPNTDIEGCLIGDGCTIVSSRLEGSTLENDVHVGPFSHVRQQSHLEAGVYVGTGVEVKESRLGHGAKSNHFSYIGDALIGTNVNIGAGAVTCNYDGECKNTTVIEDGTFIGCDTMMVAPVTIGARSVTGAGAVVTKDIPPDTLAKGVPAEHEPIDSARPRPSQRRLTAK